MKDGWHLSTTPTRKRRKIKTRPGLDLPSLLSSPTTPSQQTKRADVCIIGAVRTPIGGLMGSLSSLSATQLGGQAIAAALRAARIEASSSSDPSTSNGGRGGGNLDVVDEVIMGNVLSAGLGQVNLVALLRFFFLF